jgi:diguanylate cyclase (GGDEF)-like protein
VSLLRPTPATSRLAVAFAAFTVVWAVWAYVLEPVVTATAWMWTYNLLYAGWVVALAGLCVVLALRRRRERIWLALAASICLFATGEVLACLDDVGVLDLADDSPLPDFFYLPAYAALALTLGVLLFRRDAAHQGRLLEAVVTGVGAAAGALPLVLHPYAEELRSGITAHEFFILMYPVCDVLLAAALAVAALSPTAPRSARLLGMAAGVCLVADQFFAIRSLDGLTEAPPWLDWLWLVQYTLMTAALLVRDRTGTAPARPEPGAFLTRRVTTLVVFALLCPVLFLATHVIAIGEEEHERMETMYAIGTLILVSLVCARLVQLLTENAATVRELQRALAERQQLSNDLDHQSRHDSVTGLPNRYQLADQAEAVLEADFLLETVLDGADTSHAVIFIDLDDFKAVNDTLGHTVGDRVLREIALRLKRVCRPDDLVARLGGDEFAVLLPGSTTSDAADTAGRMIARLAEPIVVGGRRITLGASAGVAEMQRGHGRYADALAEADVAMYAAKRAGKNRVAVFAEDMRRDLLDDANLAADLQRALRDRTLSVAYQPLVHLATGRTEGLEALARWHHPERGDLSPAVFLPIATERGLIADLDFHILDLALDQATVWRHMEPDLFVGVNAAAATLARADFVQVVLEKLERAGLPGEALVVEVTEQSLIDDVPSAAARLGELRRHGIRIALDDFGTGYSSLSSLQDLPVDKLKLDRSFLARGVTNGVISPLLRTVVTLGHDLGMTVVAEGIETQEHFEAMRALGCDAGQGWLLSRPMPPEDVFRHLSAPSVAQAPVP